MNTELLTAIIIDDETNELFVMAEKIKKCGNIDVVATSRNIKEGAFLILKHRPDLVFLDIQMPDGSGFELLKVFPHIDFGVIFFTGYEQYAIQALEYSSLPYLLKPVKISLLNAAIEQFRKVGKPSEVQLELVQAIQQDGKKIDRILLPKKGNLQMVMLKDITFIEADGAITYIYTETEERFTRSVQLGQFHNQLPSDIFYRIHNKYVININQIKSINTEKNEVIISPNKSLPIAVGKRVAFFHFLKEKGWI